jgi:lipopolysaccharide/colanic/teichoic acid biosynthesis glycosyltransferase
MAMLVKDGSALAARLGPDLTVQIPDDTTSPFVRLAELLHSSAAHPAVLLTDAVLVAASAIAVATTPPARIGVLSLLPLGAVIGLYRRRACLESQGLVWYARALALPTALLVAALLLWPQAGTWRMEAARGVGVAACLMLAVRAILWFGLAVSRRRGVGLRPTLVSGPAAAVDQVLRRLSAFPECGLRATSVHIPLERSEQRSAQRSARPGPGIAPRRALDLIDHRHVEAVLLVSAGGDRGTYDELVQRGEGSGIEYGLVVPLAAHAGGPFRSRIGDLGIVPLGQVNYSSRKMPGKRVFDVVLSAAFLTMLFPALGFIAIAVKLSDRGPAFYAQERVGRGGGLFKMWKFRSMVIGADQMVADHQHDNYNNGLLFKLEADPRITRIGSWLRRLSVDELPQLFNVLKGDMSFVGPRPLPVDPDAFDEVAGKRHSVRPGITGPWQVHGGHALSYEDMVSLDLSYITGWSFRHDLWLLALTVPALLVRRAPVV